MKKIVFIGTLGFGGAEHQMVLLAKSLAERGYDVTFFNTDTFSFYEEYAESLGIHIVSVPEHRILKSYFKLRIPLIIFYLFRYVRKRKIDVGISFLGECNFANCLVAKLSNGKYKAITGLRNARNSLLLSRREQLYTKYEKYAIAKVCNSENGLNLYKNNFPQLADKLTVIYNIIAEPKAKSTYIYRQLNKVHFIVPASYRSVKNPLGLIEALSLMTDDERETIRIHWYGENDGGTSSYYSMLMSEIEHKELQNVIELKGATKQIENRMNEADVVALFSSSEGFPNVICEGMMLGKPILMTRVSDYNLMVDDSNGKICDWNDPNSIKEALLSFVFLSEAEIRAKGKVSKERAMELFSNENTLQKWSDLINK